MNEREFLAITEIIRRAPMSEAERMFVEALFMRIGAEFERKAKEAEASKPPQGNQT